MCQLDRTSRQGLLHNSSFSGIAYILSPSLGLRGCETLPSPVLALLGHVLASPASSLQSPGQAGRSRMCPLHDAQSGLTVTVSFLLTPPTSHELVWDEVHTRF